MKVQPIHTAVDSKESALMFVFNRENQCSGQYLQPVMIALRSRYVESMLKLRDGLQYCMSHAENETPQLLNSEWRLYLNIWLDTLSVDVANAISVYSHDSGALEKIEGLVCERARKFVELMVPGECKYYKAQFNLTI